MPRKSDPTRRREKANWFISGEKLKYTPSNP
jgi:hypothetical protein